MNDKIILFSKTFYNREAVLEAKRFSVFSVILLFFVICLIISFPMYKEKTYVTVDEMMNNLPGINAALTDLYNQELPFKIDDNGNLVKYGEVSDTVIGNYRLVFTDEIDANAYAGQSVVVFGQEEALIQHYDANTKTTYAISGSYNLLSGTDFGQIKQSKPDGETLDEYYADTTKFLIHSINFSDIVSVFIQITMFQFVQFLIYVAVITVLLFTSNFFASSFKIKLSDCFKITVIAAVTPAFLAAFISLFSTIFGAYLFSIIYALRLVYIYMGLLKHKRLMEKIS